MKVQVEYEAHGLGAAVSPGEAAHRSSISEEPVAGTGASRRPVRVALAAIWALVGGIAVAQGVLCVMAFALTN